MQCEIRALSERRENGRKRVSDTLPKPGRVNEVCKEWLVKEDGALAYQLQQKEVQEHYSGNRSRNAIVREDFPKALDEQKREEEEAMARYLEMTRMQEERDARLAKEFAQRITLEEEEKQQRRLHEDQAIASQIQEKELQRTKEAKTRHLMAGSGGSSAAAAAAVGDVNSVGLPLPVQQVPSMAHAHKSHHQQHQHHHQQHLQQLTKQFRATNVDEPDEPDLTDLEFQEEMMRQMQEKKDEELAKMLQQQEEEMDSLGMLDKDRLLAIEAQDKELAKLLQDKERAKARRARERAKQRALLKKQQQEMNATTAETAADVVGHSPAAAASRPNNLDVIRINKPKMPEPEEIERVAAAGAGGSSSGCVVPTPPAAAVNTLLPSNIAMAIDPTYTPPSSSSSSSSTLHTTSCAASPISSPSYSLPSPDFEEDDDSPVPPYMPIQGQRRTSSLEKKHKKNKKDSCKQQ